MIRNLRIVPMIFLGTLLASTTACSKAAEDGAKTSMLLCEAVKEAKAGNESKAESLVDEAKVLRDKYDDKDKSEKQKYREAGLSEAKKCTESLDKYL